MSSNTSDSRSAYSSRSSAKKRGWRKTVENLKMAWFESLLAMMKSGGVEKHSWIALTALAIESLQMLSFAFNNTDCMLVYKLVDHHSSSNVCQHYRGCSRKWRWYCCNTHPNRAWNCRLYRLWNSARFDSHLYHSDCRYGHFSDICDLVLLFQGIQGTFFCAFSSQSRLYRLRMLATTKHLVWRLAITSIENYHQLIAIHTLSASFDNFASI